MLTQFAITNAKPKAKPYKLADMGGLLLLVKPTGDALAHLGLTDLVVGPHQFEGLALDQRVFFLLERRAGLAEALAPAARHRPAGQRVGWHFVEEIRHGYIEDLGELEQPTRANAVGSALVLLDLLECQAHGIADSCLAHAEQ